MRKKQSFFKKFIWSLLGVLLISGAITASVFYSRIYQSNVSLDYQKEVFIYIPSSASFEDVLQQLTLEGIIINSSSFRWISERKRYTNNIKSGRYLIKDGMNNNELVNLLRSGRQTPVNVVFNNVRTKEDFAGIIADQLELDSVEIIEAMLDTVFLNNIGLNAFNVSSLFIPNTYEFYWNTSIMSFLSRMVAENHHFWNNSRKAKCKLLNLKKEEVITLASIVEKETLKKDEQPIVAGLYLNRLKKNMLLQSDPTVIFAIGDFSIRRVLKKDLKYDSPYNTYKYKGLPIGPISLPSIGAIDAVLNYQKHDYLFMCAKEDFSGYHNFAKNVKQHNVNAKKYRKALNDKKIKR
ncbi:MAG: aminodeoxychorismate lyase [Flavobacteriales bacterium]|nr:aminodeoxychorismate lyase [Flavobacteriales bacterium]